jgi:PAS domain S-box-containing protein
MDVQPGDVAEEIKRLQRCIRDLVSLFALPAMWSGAEPYQIVHTLLDALLRMLQLDLVYVRLRDPGGGVPLEMVRFAPSRDQAAQHRPQPREIGEVFKHWLGADPRAWPPLIRKPIEGRDISIVPLGLGLQGEIGQIVAGSERADFPRQTERLILSVAANQASIGLQGAQLLSEQKQVAIAREKAEAELRERATGLEAKVRRLIDANLMGIFTWNTEGRIIEANETFLNTVQWGREDLASAGMHWTDLTPEEWRARDEMAVSDVMATGTAQPYRKEYFRKDGSRVPVLVGAARFEERGSDGVAFALDLTEQKHAEEAFRRVEEQARSIVDSALDAVVVMDADGMIRDWNKQAEETFGWTRPEALGRRMVDTIIPAHYRLAHEKGLEQFLKTGQGPVLNRRIEITALRRDGAEFPVELTITPLKSGDAWTFSSFIRDITARRQAQEDLRNAQAELAHVNRVMTMGELAASIAHEVNQPLAAIVASGDSCTAWLQSEPPNLEKARAAADRIVQAATQASDIVRRIRALFKKTTSISTPLEINEVIAETISLAGGEVQRKGVSLNTALAVNLPAVLGDRVQLQQVILNLVINATEAMAGVENQPRRLTIQSLPSGTGEVLVSVADTGPGIDPQHTARLFAPFFTTKAEGIGMGLSISRSIIEAHGGRLWAAANQPRGAVFHFALPFVTNA